MREDFSKFGQLIGRNNLTILIIVIIKRCMHDIHTIYIYIYMDGECGAAATWVGK